MSRFQRTVFAAAIAGSFCGSLSAQGIRNVPTPTFPTIQSAIAGANPGDSVLVAPGTYAEHLDFLGKNITVRGFAGAGQTVVDGTNTGRPVTFSNGEGPTARLEGLTLRNGRPVTCLPSGQWCDGGGILCIGASPTISDCVIHNNITTGNGSLGSTGHGGGVGAFSGSHPTLVRCVVRDNRLAPATFCDVTGFGFDGNSGGGVFASPSGFGVQSTITCIDCRILSNHGGQGGDANLIDPGVLLGGSGGDGGGVYGACLLINCVIAGNGAGDGGDSQWGGNNGRGGDGGGVAGLAVLVSCTLWGNFAGTGGNDPGGPMGPPGAGGGIAEGVAVYNSILSQNLPDQIFSTPLVAFSNVQGGAAGTGNLSGSPELVDPENGDFHLLPTSACINAGSNQVPNLPTMDFEGDPRIVCGVTDIGADEYSAPSAPGELWVDSTAAPGGCGSPTGPFTMIQQAIGAAANGYMIVVRSGVYHETIDFMGKSITVRSSDGPLSTVIDAQGLGPVVRFETNESNTTILFGFTLRNGLADRGGAVRCHQSSPRISNCIIRDNQAQGPQAAGGGILCDAASPRISNCLLIDNFSQGPGGAIACEAGSTPQIVHSTLSSNTATGTGSGVSSTGGSNPTIINSIVYGNLPPSNQVWADPQSNAFVAFSTVESGWTGPGSNVSTANPTFVAAAQSNYQLATGSPAIGSGTTILIALEAIDLSNQFRNQGVPDHGAFEHYAACGPPPLITCTPGGVGNGSLVYVNPGTPDDFGLFTRVDGGGDPFADRKDASAGQLLSIFIHSNYGTFANRPAALAAQIYPTGTSLIPNPPIPGVQLSAASLVVLLSFSELPVLGPAGITFSVTVPAGLAGLTARVQAITLSPTANNGIYATTPAFEFDFH